MILHAHGVRGADGEHGVTSLFLYQLTLKGLNPWLIWPPLECLSFCGTAGTAFSPNTHSFYFHLLVFLETGIFCVALFVLELALA